MKKSNIKTPGVTIDESNAFPNSVVPVATAAPAFIGYTPQALYQGRSYINIAQRITSFAEFQAIYCFPDKPKQTNPEYYLLKQSSQSDQNNSLLINSDYYSILPDPNTIYYLYNSIKMFFENGGVVAYIVSIGNYGTPSKKAMTPDDQMINLNVQSSDLLQGLEVLKKETEPTMYICPEATLLSQQENAALMQAMLQQNSQMQTAISIFDIIGGHNPDPIEYTNDINNFRDNTGLIGLDYGTVYYPFIGTDVMQGSGIDFTNLFGGDINQLAPLINPENDPNIESILTTIKNTPTELNDYALKYIGWCWTKVLIYSKIIFPSSGFDGFLWCSKYS